jgi:two-component system sensor histidine kinase KdpD
VDVAVNGDALVRLDPRLTSAALAHLLENAAQYSPPGRPILVQARIEGEGLHVSVTDHGPGLDPGELDHLFERFYRGRSAKHATYGTGMGLSITRGLLAAAGGRVWAENMPGAGARFTMLVPGRVRAAVAL